jgi:UDP:flavonoid glycosyltransferase YjiC (YdhE family)
MAERARAAGFETFEAGPAESLLRVVADRMPSPDVLASDAGRSFFFAEVFVGLELERRAADLERVLATWEPDVVVHELAELAAPLVAASAGVPYATSSYGPLPSPAVMRAAGAAAASHWQRRGLPADAYAGAFRHLYRDVCPPSLQLPWAQELGAVHAVRPSAAIAADGDGRPPSWLDDLRTDRIVYVTFGTVWNRDAELFRMVLDAVADDALALVLTVGRGLDPAALGPSPANVHIATFIPQAQILPHCRAVVCHGGAGTVLGALGHGRPLLVLPQAADHFASGARVAAAGAGRMLRRDEQSATALRDAVHALLDEPRYRRAAGTIAAEIAAMPEPDAAIPALRALHRSDD